jgi:hypothetical protein
MEFATDAADIMGKCSVHGRRNLGSNQLLAVAGAGYMCTIIERAFNSDAAS